MVVATESGPIRRIGQINGCAYIARTRITFFGALSHGVPSTNLMRSASRYKVG